MLWSRLGAGVETGLVTCEWVDHPGQLHKALQEPEGSCSSGAGLQRRPGDAHADELLDVLRKAAM